jgi:hypothetical protein
LAGIATLRTVSGCCVQGFAPGLSIRSGDGPVKAPGYQSPQMARQGKPRHHEKAPEVYDPLKQAS